MKRRFEHVAFVDDPADWAHAGALREVCAELNLQPVSRRTALLRGASGLLSGQPVTTGFYRNRILRSWVRGIAARRSLDAIFVYSSSMAQYVLDLDPGAAARRVIDFCDVDSDKWRQFAASHGMPRRWVYAPAM